MGKANKIFARSMAAVLSLTALLGATACGGGGGGEGGDNSDKTVIKVANFGGGVGQKWLTEAFDRFKANYEGVEVTPGKTGIAMELKSDTGVKVKNLNTQTEHMFFVQPTYSDCFIEIQSGNVVDITDIVTTPLTEYGETRSIAEKLDPNYAFAMKGIGADAEKYYLLPHYETYAAASYDYDLFTKMGWFLATTGEEEDMFTTDLLPGQTYYFTKNANKTVGNDGIAGTDDDGMPTTLNELVAMCAKIKDDEVAAFSVAGIGYHIDYMNHLVEAIWTALAGYDQRMAVVSQNGMVDQVTGVSSTELWPGTGIMKPVTQPVTLTGDGSDGYKAIDQKGRYYAFAFLELAYQQDWIYKGYKGSYNHQDAMEAFVLNGIKGRDLIASHVEGTYWYNECDEKYGYFVDYKTLNKADADGVKDIRFWHMPTAYEDGEVVTSTANARKEAIMSSGTAACAINQTAINAEGANKDAVLNVCKQFFRFLYSEQELQNFTSCTGVAKAFVDYEIGDAVLANLDSYQVSIMNMRANDEQYEIVSQYGDNDVYRYKSGYVTYRANCTGYTVDTTGFVNDSASYACILQAYYATGTKGINDAGYLNAWKCFQYTSYAGNDGKGTKWMDNVYNPAVNP